MGRKCKGDSPLNKSFAFRLETRAKTLALEKKIAQSGVSTSEYLRTICDREESVVIAVSPHKAHAVFLLNKASNNINQLAHRANTAHQSGKLDQGSLSLITSELQKLNDFLIEQVEAAK